MNQQHIKKFQAFIYYFFDNYGRHDLPWRRDYNPYQIMVSEIMLQQTQVDRVIPKFHSFLQAFPTVKKLAQASPADVIRQWQGLGYNRRGLNLQKAAQMIVRDFQSQVPTNLEELLILPGIGPYTAAAILAFAFNQPLVVIETNIRTVFISHFFHGAYSVEDKKLITLIEQTMDRQQPRRWYSALMDYGTYLKSVLPNPNRQSQTYSKQSKLEGSNRQVRGKILKALTEHELIAIDQLPGYLHLTTERIEPALAQLVKEGFVEYQADQLKLKA